MSAELTVIDPHGELLDPRTASTERLARCLADVGYVRDRLADLTETVGAEVLRRLDADATWTQRVEDDDGTVYEIKAPSPAAGSESYPELALENVLRELVGDSTVSAAGAEQALKRTLILELSIPWAADPEEIASTLGDVVSIEVGGYELRPTRVEVVRRAVKSGISKLAKVPGVAVKLDEAKVTVEPPPRRVKVTARQRRCP